MSVASTDTSVKKAPVPPYPLAQNILVDWANESFPEASTLTAKPTFIDDIRKHLAAIRGRPFSDNTVTTEQKKSFLQSERGRYLIDYLQSGRTVGAHEKCRGTVVAGICASVAGGVCNAVIDGEEEGRSAREVLFQSIFITLEELHELKWAIEPPCITAYIEDFCARTDLGLTAITAVLKRFDGADGTAGDAGRAVEQLLDEWYGVLSDIQSDDSSAR
ncbi:uncharacterized protein MKK02DRAFT_40877 [Dioszegia hungarica]|uniref:Uncharacterized protein n=1 Tax=Dioszegia hungarica TaxID=4972 RepID=A0AA38H158_9TREE|nr:uncharacterized protein MKK02DRAFT_40877 [Dioszegia hungarica]KAI9632573.1 hypothetical protein MKK02DRAFT_40877 [Dioszegia hungarica]